MSGLHYKVKYQIILIKVIRSKHVANIKLKTRKLNQEYTDSKHVANIKLKTRKLNQEYTDRKHVANIVN